MNNNFIEVESCGTAAMQPLKILIMGALYQSLGEKDTAMQVSKNLKYLSFHKMYVSKCLHKKTYVSSTRLNFCSMKVTSQKMSCDHQ